MASIALARVEDIMITKIVTLKETDKMDHVARALESNDINAAPIVDDDGKCVGIITSHDIVEYESARAMVSKHFKTNSEYSLSIDCEAEMFRLPGRHYHEAGFHMSKTLQTAAIGDSLSRVARQMCQQHIHHVIVLDQNQKPVGMLSSLDLLGYVIDEPVCRTAVCPVESDSS